MRDFQILKFACQETRQIQTNLINNSQRIIDFRQFSHNLRYSCFQPPKISSCDCDSSLWAIELRIFATKRKDSNFKNKLAWKRLSEIGIWNSYLRLWENCLEPIILWLLSMGFIWIWRVSWHAHFRTWKSINFLIYGFI